MSMANLTAAVVAINGLKDTFLAKAAEINAAVAAAVASYAGLAADLKATVANVMDVTITYNPAVAANVVDGGTFQTWAQLAQFMDTTASGARIKVALLDNAVLDMTLWYVHPSFAHIHFLAASGAPLAANRPKINVKIYDKVAQNQWSHLYPGNGGSIKIEHVDIVFATDINAGVGNSLNTAFCFATPAQRYFLQVISSKITAFAGLNFHRIEPGCASTISLTGVEFAGAFTAIARPTGGAAILSATGVTLSGSAVLHSGFTTGTNLLLG